MLLIFPKISIREPIIRRFKTYKDQRKIHMLKMITLSRLFYTDFYVFLLFLLPKTNLRRVMYESVDDILGS